MRPGGDERCPLCGAEGPFEGVVDVRKRVLRHCGRCRLVFAAAADLPGAAAERERYVKHRNGPFDAGYVSFLRQAVGPALPHLKRGMRGLDYGCGHDPTLCLLLGEAGVTCENYDVFFFPELPAGPFDFVFATEVVEHFHRPAGEWAKLAGLLRPGGVLTVMTAPWTDLGSFRTWGYASDETHVCFYRGETLEWIRGALGFEELDGANPRVSVMRKR